MQDKFHLNHFATATRAGKHGFLWEILLTKDFPHTSHGKNPLHSICRHCCCYGKNACVITFRIFGKILNPAALKFLSSLIIIRVVEISRQGNITPIKSNFDFFLIVQKYLSQNETTTKDSNTAFLGEKPTRKGKIHTLYGFSLCTRFSSNVVFSSHFSEMQIALRACTMHLMEKIKTSSFLDFMPARLDPSLRIFQL